MFEQSRFSIDGLADAALVDAAVGSTEGTAQAVEPHPDADRHAAEWADCSGAVLAKLIADAMSSVAQIPDSLAGDAELFDVITATVRVEAWTAAIRAKLIAEVYARALAEHQAHGLVRGPVRGSAGPSGLPGSDAGASHRFDDSEYTRREIAANLSLELGVPLPVAEREVRIALALVRDEELRQALSSGRVDQAQTRAVVEELEHIPSAEVRRPVLASVITPPEAPHAQACLVRELASGAKRVWDLPPADLRAIIRREAQRLEPELATIRAESAREDRHVRYHQRRDTMADLVLHGTAESLSAVYRHLDLTAHAARRKGADGTIDQLRHDIAVGWLTEGSHGLYVVHREVTGRSGQQIVLPRPRAAVTVNVTVADTTLLGLDELPAVLHSPTGPVPIPADLARQLAYDPDQATWRRILCDPSTGVATDVSAGYRPAGRIADFVTVRDGHQSRFPTSHASHLELDHLIRYDHVDRAAGGRTTSANLASQGRWDHHLKTDGAITVEGDANGRLTYRGRSGRGHSSLPHQYLDPVTPNDNDPPF